MVRECSRRKSTGFFSWRNNEKLDSSCDVICRGCGVDLRRCAVGSCRWPVSAVRCACGPAGLRWSELPAGRDRHANGATHVCRRAGGASADPRAVRYCKLSVRLPCRCNLYLPADPRAAGIATGGNADAKPACDERTANSSFHSAKYFCSCARYSAGAESIGPRGHASWKWLFGLDIPPFFMLAARLLN